MSEKPPTAANLRYLKRERQVTWQALAEQVGVQERMVYAWASDDGPVPTWPNCVRLGKELGVEPGWFFELHSEVTAMDNHYRGEVT